MCRGAADCEDVGRCMKLRVWRECRRRRKAECGPVADVVGAAEGAEGGQDKRAENQQKD